MKPRLLLNKHALPVLLVVAAVEVNTELLYLFPDLFHLSTVCLHDSLSPLFISLLPFSSPLSLFKLTCLGTMRHKLTVKATDDVYEKTKIRVTQVEEERKGHVYVHVHLCVCAHV